jgi:hypothetical protein
VKRECHSSLGCAVAVAKRVLQSTRPSAASASIPCVYDGIHQPHGAIFDVVEPVLLGGSSGKGTTATTHDQVNDVGWKDHCAPRVCVCTLRYMWLHCPKRAPYGSAKTRIKAVAAPVLLQKQQDFQAHQLAIMSCDAFSGTFCWYCGSFMSPFIK